MSTMKRMWTDREIRSMADESAKIRIEDGHTENAKPLYFHPISIIHGSGQSAEFMCSLIVLNNSKTAIDSWDKLVAFFNEVYDNLEEGISYARFPCTGFIKGASKTIVSSVIEISGKSTSTRVFVGMDTSDGSLTRITSGDVAGTPRVEDGVNKIN